MLSIVRGSTGGGTTSKGNEKSDSIILSVCARRLKSLRKVF